jgi:hypothetical protein
MTIVGKPAAVAPAVQEQTMWWRWTLGIAGIFAFVIIAGYILGNPSLSKNSLPRITIGALLLASNGVILLRGERLKRTSQEEYELYQIGKLFGDKQAVTWKERLLATLDGPE